ncbi:MAG: hypothetical protein CL884_03250 [Dehalococcoidia bacterium]|jgi:hypothetical protein|nr:hypothetical protein [Dehalococcoidia bacterium]MQG08664.1 hypothetical protein [SAR202 cluster bacterium]MQG35317.1 hypothetical protein [SAR202 cluster bacterium]MQG85757.1 hypothetical protein [SAR202 cluster bacterium]|tara:strand:+ start:9084 stop:9728 length:645 start_codon:yes stop_codon:yes gene_type:complete
MDSYTPNKVGGLCLIIGPALATLIYILSEFLFSTGAGLSPADFSGRADAIANALAYERLILLVIPVALVCAFNGLRVVQGMCKADGVGDGLTGLGLIMFLFNVIVIVVAIGAFQAFAWVGANGDIAAMLGGVQTMGGLIGSVGVMLFALGLSTRSEFNKIFSLVIAILFGISAITSVIGMNDTSSWEIISAYWGLTYIAISAYSIHLGLVIRKK